MAEKNTEAHGISQLNIPQMTAVTANKQTNKNAQTNKQTNRHREIPSKGKNKSSMLWAN